ncbi:energy transducer TonB [Thermoproteota archaeon]
MMKSFLIVLMCFALTGCAFFGTKEGDLSRVVLNALPQITPDSTMEEYKAYLGGRITAFAVEQPQPDLMNQEIKEVTVIFSLMRDGSLSYVAVFYSSKNDELDKLAVDTVKKAAPFTPFPDSLNNESEQDFFITLDYTS